MAVMVEQFIVVYLLQLFIFGGAGYLLNMSPKGTMMHVTWLQIGLLCLPGIGIIAGIIMLIRYIFI